MENITAFFYRSDDMQQAADALRQQGVIHIQIFPGDSASEYTLTSQDGSFLPVSLDQNQHEGHLQILVESSRRKQAEATIFRHGGQLPG